MDNNNYQNIIAGGGIAGLVTALELLQAGQNVCLIDRDTPERLGGLARWAFGGMALCNTEQQKKMSIPDEPARMLKDWHSFAEFTEADHWPKQWAKEYAEHNHEKVYLWLKQLGCKFLPAVNWVERGLFVSGNSLPRYHVLWGTGWGLIETIIAALKPYIDNESLVILHQHKVLSLISTEQGITGVNVIDEAQSANTQQNETISSFEIFGENTIVACGGINGSLARVKANWYKAWGEPPSQLLNGANPISDGALHDAVNAIGGTITREQNMWNYAAGIAHPQPDFEQHGLSLIPCKSALWLNHLGERIGPQPLMTCFDTHYLCEQVAKQEKPWTWQILNWKIAAKELAVSGSLHNPSIRDKKTLTFLKEVLFGNHRLVKQLEQESDDFITADSIDELVKQMNAQTEQAYIDKATLLQTIEHYDSNFVDGQTFENDDQIRRLRHLRQWKTDKLRTCVPKPILDPKAGKLIAIKVQLISRKSLGGVQTNLQSQVLNQQEQVIPNLYCVGEAAGFGGGGASGKRSLEGTFLSGCILTARNAAQAIIADKN